MSTPHRTTQIVIDLGLSTRDKPLSNFNYIEWFWHNFHPIFAFRNQQSICHVELLNPWWNVRLLNSSEYLKVTKFKSILGIEVIIDNIISGQPLHLKCGPQPSDFKYIQTSVCNSTPDGLTKRVMGCFGSLFCSPPLRSWSWSGQSKHRGFRPLFLTVWFIPLNFEQTFHIIVDQIYPLTLFFTKMFMTRLFEPL